MAHLETALRCLHTTIALFGAEATCLSFNGGKDSTALLHLVLQAFPDTYHRITFVYFDQEDEFVEVKQFIAECDRRYQLRLRYLTASYKEGLEELVTQSGIKAVFLGTRDGDPGAEKLAEFIPSDPGWPLLMRVHPILHWTYDQVWDYLEGKPYCSLYGLGYTSLGSVSTTLPNPMLRQPGGTFAHANQLRDSRHERCGRGKQPQRSEHTAAHEEQGPGPLWLAFAVVAATLLLLRPRDGS